MRCRSWNPELCIQCGQCSFVCPHSVIRAKYFDGARLDGAPAGFQSAPINVRGYPGRALHAAILRGGLHGLRTLRGGLPGGEPIEAGVKAINMDRRRRLVEPDAREYAFFERCR